MGDHVQEDEQRPPTVRPVPGSDRVCHEVLPLSGSQPHPGRPRRSATPGRLVLATSNESIPDEPVIENDIAVVEQLWSGTCQRAVRPQSEGDPVNREAMLATTFVELADSLVDYFIDGRLEIAADPVKP